jgi:hypothetical protein
MISASVQGGGALWRDYVRGRFRWGAPFLLMLLGLIAPGAAEASTYRWQVDASGNWNDPANWDVVTGPAGVGYPSVAGDVAVIDEPFTAARTITIPTGVTITIGELTATSAVSIARDGTGLLVFDNLGEDAEVGTTGAAVVFSAPIQLAAHLVIDGNFTFTTISETGGSRNVTMAGGQVVFIQPNTYTGTTTIADGSFQTSQTALGSRIPGPFIVGDGTGAARSATVTLAGDSIDHSADVTVNADGSVGFVRNITFFAPGHVIGDLTIADGYVLIAWTGANLTVQGDMTMQGGEVFLEREANVLNVAGSLTATSTAAGAAVVRSGRFEPLPPGSFTLLAGPHDVTIADGPQAVDFFVDVARFGADELTKLGAGTMRVNNGGAGPTAVLGGTLVLGYDWPGPLQVGAQATLTGWPGAVGPITVAAGGTLSPGFTVGTLLTGSVAFSTGAHFAVEMPGTASYDRLHVIGTVTLGNATLDVITSGFLFPPTATFTIIDNDGNDPVVGTFAGYPEGSLYWVAPGGPVFTVSYQGGDGNDVTLTNATAVEYFLSEGATGTFFDEEVAIANPNAVPAPTSMVFLLPNGGVKVENFTVPAQSRMTVKVDEIEGLENVSTSVEVHSENRLTLAVERTMFWDSRHYGGHTANSVSRAERQWFFAEGAQNDFFNTFLLLANPNGPVTAKVTFFRESEPPFVLDVDLAGVSRTTISAGDHTELVGRSFGIMVEAPERITAERAMYFASTPQRFWSGGHDNVGSHETSTTWFHPEGASGTFFTTFILMSNPQNQAANVTMKFLLPGGSPVEITKTIPAQSRLTVNPGSEVSALANASFSTVVTSDVPIVSERAMYWPTDDAAFGEGHASSGLTTTALDWTLAEGRVGGPFAYTTYILLANPQTSTANVKVTYLRESGEPVVKEYPVAANTRFNIDVGGMVPELQNESFGALIEVTNDVPIAVERSIYWNVDGQFWSGGTNAVGSIVPR